MSLKHIPVTSKTGKTDNFAVLSYYFPDLYNQQPRKKNLNSKHQPAKFRVKTRVTNKMGMITVPMVTTRSKGSSNLSCTMSPASAPPFSSCVEPGMINSFSFSPASRAVAMSKFCSKRFCIRQMEPTHS